MPSAPGRLRCPIGSVACGPRATPAGCLIPPFEYHVLANALDEPSITLHVYGGEMTTCHVFVPAADGRYVRKERPLCYHE